MIRRKSSVWRVVLGVLACAAMAACDASHGDSPSTQAFIKDALPCAGGEPPPALGLMTSLPLYWPLAAEMSDLASGVAEVPWQRTVIEQCHTMLPLDTLSPIPGLVPDAPDTVPLAGLEFLAVIQPRGLSPADNAALDEWVREGGTLLLVLDPQLTGHYELPLGDPRRPTDTALVAPVVKRWGLGIDYAIEDIADEAVRSVSYPGGILDIAYAGEITLVDPEAADCTVHADGVLARCFVGKGRVTLIADAAVFEHGAVSGLAGDHADHTEDVAPDELARERAKRLIDLMRFAFSL